MRIKAYMAGSVEDVSRFIDDCKKCRLTMIKDVIWLEDIINWR